jgi:hypothetical protein
MHGDTRRFARSVDVAAQELGGGEGGVLLHLKSGQYHGLDTVGWAIWSLLDGSRSIAQITEALRERFPDAPPRLPQDVTEFVESLLTRDLVEVDGT